MERSNLPAHHIYNCRRCGDSWLEENEASKSVFVNNRCMTCGSTQVTRSSSLPLPLAHELLRSNVTYTVKNVAKLVENSSAKNWSKSRLFIEGLFQEQVDLLTNIYDAIIMNSKYV